MNATHFVGIGGTGLSAIARVMFERGETVTGSDREESTTTQVLRAAGIKIFIGHTAANVNGATRVIRSSAVSEHNVEVRAAHEKGVPVFKRSEILAELLAGQHVIAVAGSHGKTTTTAMIAWLLTQLGYDPGYIIGSMSPNLKGNAAAGGGELFVIEADEYDHMFLGLSPTIAVVTNIEYDHPDLFPDQESFHEAFKAFADRLEVGGTLIVCADNPGAVALKNYAEVQGKRTISYSVESAADYSVSELQAVPGLGYAFTLVKDGRDQGANVQLQIPGKHNAENALAALAVADQLALSLPTVASALSAFEGTSRRFEVVGEASGVLVIDDYAHHPTEIRASLAAARDRYPGRRLWALWQPHTYSRTQTLWSDFTTSFADADKVIVTSVFAAREQPSVSFDLQELVAQVEHEDIQFASDFAIAQDLLLSNLQPGDVLIVLSAGDAVQLSKQLIKKLSQRNANDA
ncbi:MAG: UDP-N-acetylmuramate--L-alanine ligase [Chloroflexi bacterium]|nr:UDP-N-acetylmuramate--L-alanine ligase [Chloroflexota bacterium]MQC26522.1 UDP-N-acetylmuramate--L-alanine ligase [Chloroflexota bacterium]